MYVNLRRDGIFEAFRRIGIHILREPDLSAMMSAVADSVSAVAGLDRCTLLLYDEKKQELHLEAEFAREPLEAVGRRSYQLRSSSEWYQLLAEGRPLPLKAIRAESAEPGATPTLDKFVSDSASQSVVAFPMLSAGRLVGCLCMHRCHKAEPFSDDVIEVGEAVAEQLSMAISRRLSQEEERWEAAVFRDSGLPLALVERGSWKILRANAAGQSLLSATEGSWAGDCLLDLFADSDRRRLTQAAAELGPGSSLVSVPSLTGLSGNGDPLVLDVQLSLLKDGDSLLAVLLPRSAEQLASVLPERAEVKLEELVSTLSRQVNLERVARHIISAMHASLDRDTVVQAAVDGLGRALAVSRCLVIRTDGPASAVVTHEYVQPDISPLGLGRTSQFPLSVVSAFKERSAAVADITSRPRSLSLPAGDLESLFESGVRAIAGTPVTHHGVTLGMVIAVQNERTRHWSPQETELIELVATELGTALSHAQAHGQIKDQLFNMNLISNLTQQLTNALELAGRAGRPAGDEAADRLPATAHPLSMRELEVLKLIASGLANREIAQKLFLTESTVELHASRIRKKLKLKSRTALVKYACDNRLV